MITDSIQIAQAEKQEIGKVVHLCNMLSNEINVIFFLRKEQGFSSKRHSFVKPDQLLEFLIVTDSDKGANDLLSFWIEKEELGDIAKDYHRNLIVVSEQEFVEEFGKLDTFCDRVITGLLVYDRDGQSIITCNEMEVVE